MYVALALHCYPCGGASVGFCPVDEPPSRLNLGSAYFSLATPLLMLCSCSLSPAQPLIQLASGCSYTAQSRS